MARGLAALAVALFHFATNGWLPAGHWLADASWHGHHGVRSFFVISGFVVPLAMWRGGYTVGALWPYLARRLARLYPPYLVSVAIMAAAAWFVGQPAGSGAMAAHAFYLNDLLGQPWLMEVYWTLAIEVQFYLLLGLLWPWVAGACTSRFLGVAALLMAGTVIPVPGRDLLEYGLYFLAGIAAFRFHARLGPRWVNGGMLAATLAMCWHSEGTAPAIAAALPLALLALPLRAPAAGRFVGEISYSLYLFHLPVGAAFFAALGAIGIHEGLRPAAVGVALALSVGAAWLAFRILERPSMAWAKRFSYRPAREEKFDPIPLRA